MIPLPPECAGCPASHVATGFVPPSGPEQSSLLLIGQGPGRDEVEGGAPFIGRSGQRLTRWCVSAGIPKRHARIANVVQCGLPKDRSPSTAEVAFCKQAHWGQELAGKGLVVAIGVPAMKALLDPHASANDAGRFVANPDGSYTMGLLHPAAILRGNWGADPHQIMHLKRARKVLDGEAPQILDWSQPAPLTNMWPTLAELEAWEQRLGPQGVTLDVEAAGNVLRLVGLRSNDTLEGVEVGFRGEGGALWVWCPECRGLDASCAHPRDDFAAVVWWLARLLANPCISKTMHNGQAYDVPEQLENTGFVVRGYEWDTLLMAHIRQPEQPKGLEMLCAAFLGLSGWKALSSAESGGDLK